MRTPLRDERGQGLVEFAVVFPLLVFFLFAVFDVGLGLNRQATLQHAVREGARWAAVADSDEAAVKDRTIKQSQDLLTAADITVCFDDMDGDNAPSPGDAIDVNAHYVFKPKFLRTGLGLFGTSLADIDINATGSSRLSAR